MAYDLKDEKDVELYLKNLGTEYRFGCYHEKKPEVCHLLADYMEGIKRDYVKAGEIYKINCEEGNYGHSCFRYGNYLYNAKGSFTTDHEKAAECYDKACDLGFPEACLNAGIVRTSKGSQVPRNPALAMEKYDKGCSLNNDKCCYYLSAMYINGVENVTKRNMEKAFTYAQKACELGNVFSCANLSQMYKKGEGVEKNHEKAEEYKRIALEMQGQNNNQFRQLTFGEGG